MKTNSIAWMYVDKYFDSKVRKLLKVDDVCDA